MQRARVRLVYDLEERWLCKHNTLADCKIASQGINWCTCVHLGHVCFPVDVAWMNAAAREQAAAYQAECTLANQHRWPWP